MGGALTALSPDFTRSVLDVTGINYSTLLSRSLIPLRTSRSRVSVCTRTTRTRLSVS